MDELYDKKRYAYGDALMKYRRGMITRDEMMALADRAEHDYLTDLGRKVLADAAEKSSKNLSTSV